jgi:hypothetical protein
MGDKTAARYGSGALTGRPQQLPLPGSKMIPKSVLHKRPVRRGLSASPGVEMHVVSTYSGSFGHAMIISCGLAFECIAI